MKIIKSFGVLSFGKLMGVSYAVLGLVFGVIFLLFSFVGFVTHIAHLGSGLLFGIGAVVAFPVLYGAMGFVLGVVGAAIYNFISHWVGGIEIEVGDKIENK